jgi:hypothetical protein
MNTRTVLPLLALSIALAAPTRGADQYWDTSTAAGWQHGNGVWSTAPGDTNWSPISGTALSVWTNLNSAYFSGNGGRSRVLVNGAAITASDVRINGSGYDLVVTNGGSLASTNLFIVGFSDATSTNNRLLVIGGEGITSRCSNVGTFWISYSGSGNEAIVDGQGFAGSAVITNENQFMLGYTHASSMSGLVTVTRGGRLSASGVIIGRSSPFNRLIVSEGGLLDTGALDVGSGSNGDDSNTLYVTDSGTLIRPTVLRIGGRRKGNKAIIANGAVVTNVATFQLGDTAGLDALLIITNGGKIYTTGVIDFGNNGAVACTGLVTGADSLWNPGAATFQVGEGTNNVIQVESSGLITNAGAVRIGAAATARGNRLVISTGGRVYSKAASAIGYTAGTADNAALATGSGSLWDLGFQNLAIGATNAPGNALTVADAARVENVALLSAASNNTLKLLGGTLVSAQATLQAGSDCVIGVAAATTPGAGWGFLAVTNGALTLGGTLKPTLLDDYVPASSDSFVIMTNEGPGSVAGVFANAGNGQTVAVYDSAGVQEGLSFTVEIGAKGVTLSGFRGRRDPGSLIIFR